MQIDYYHSAPIPSRHANSVNVIRTCDAFKAEGCDITLMCARGEGDEQGIYRDYGVRHPFPIVRTSMSQARFIGSTKFRAYAAMKILSRKGFVFTRDIAVAYIAGLLKRPFAYEMHVMPRKSAQKIMLRAVVDSPSLIRFISISKSLNDQVTGAHRKKDDPRFIVVPLGANVSHEDPWAQGETADQTVIGYVGHLYPRKGEEIIRGLSERIPELQFEVVGLSGGLSAANLPNLTLHGVVTHVEAMRLLNHFGIVLAPYQKGSSDFAGVDISQSFSPLKLFEYMAAGRPIVCSDLPVLREILTEGENALFVEADNVQAWEQAVRRLAGDPALRRRLGQAAYRTVKERFAYDVRAKRMIAEFVQ